MPIRICIIGAGISGLYLAMLLDELHLPNFSYEILESNKRTGGRVYTHRFGPKASDYYDAGAMRFPKIPPLQRTFDLFERCDVDIVPYCYEAPHCPTMFNGVSIPSNRPNEAEHDPFRFSISNGGLVPNHILKRAFTPFISRLADDFQEGFAELMKYDHMTTREFLKVKMGLDFYSICHMETVLSASGLYDQSLSESVLDYMDFEYPTTSGRSVEWYRVSGGTSRVIEKMEAILSRKPSLGSRVTSIEYQTADSHYPMSVQVEGETQSREYSAVFSTASLPCIRRIAVGQGILSPGQRTAIQNVHYDASTKIAVKFKTAWWTKYCQIRGGQASTDLPIRTCVYPSSGTNTEDVSTVLLCSYTWGQDAQQIASLTGQDSDGARKKELEHIVHHNLALLHQSHTDSFSSRPYGYRRMLKIIQNEYVCLHAYNWYDDPSASGAFAYFGPGQFRHFYPELVSPAADGHMFLVGEACSAHHAWISGSLDSAYRGLMQYFYKLIIEGRVGRGVLDKLKEAWGPLDEMSEEMLEWQAILAHLARR